MNHNRNGSARALKVGIFAHLPKETALGIAGMRNRAQQRERQAYINARTVRVKGDASLTMLADAAVASCPAFGGDK